MEYSIKISCQWVPGVACGRFATPSEEQPRNNPPVQVDCHSTFKNEIGPSDVHPENVFRLQMVKTTASFDLYDDHSPNNTVFVIL
jgi:hypothetical protein